MKKISKGQKIIAGFGIIVLVAFMVGGMAAKPVLGK